MSNFLKIFFALILLFSQTIFAKSPPPGTGKADVPANILIMLDTSGSMGAYVSSSQRIYYPSDVATDSNGNIYVLERSYNRIKKYNSSGTLIKTVGRSGRSSATGGSPYFRYPYRIAIDSNDNIYVSDYSNYKVQKLDTNLRVLKHFNTGGYAMGVAVDNNTGDVYTTATNGYVKRYSSSGALLAQWTTQYGRPYGISVYNNEIYIIQSYSSRVHVHSTNGSVIRTINIGQYAYGYPDVEVNSNGVYVSTGYNSYVYKYSHAGVYQTRWGGYGSGNSNFRYNWGLGSDSSGKIYVADYYGNGVKVFDSSGAYLSSIGGIGGTRLDEAKKVIKKLVSSSDLTRGANFGLMKWHSRAYLDVPISASGANRVFSVVDSYRASGGTNLDNAMRLAQSYFSGSSSPINSNANCQKNFLIVISDGYWYDRIATSTARNLFNSKGIQTFAIGFHGGGGSNYTNLAKAGGTYPDSPLYSSNWQHLYETLKNYIRQAISSRLTFSSPVIMPGISTTDHLFQSTFIYKTNHQWQGELTKYQLKSDGTLGSKVWEAGKKLDAKTDSSRKIWTIGISDTSLNNFTTANNSELLPLLWEDSGSTPSTSDVDKLINFVRGKDSYDEDADNSTTDSRWKLGDIYHSKLAVVNSPSAAIETDPSKINTEAYYRHQKNYNNFKTGNSCGGSCPNRKEVVYVGANDGMLHALDSKTGDELWGFIPPNLLPNLRDVISSKSNSTHSIYGVDGSPVVKDIFINNQWKTVLFSGLGRGGFGYFALDITNPSSPEFLFAFENVETSKIIKVWDSQGNRTDYGYSSGSVLSDIDFSKLGESWSTPVITSIPDGNDRKWVAVFGAGYNSGTNTSYGSSVYVIDLGDSAKILKRIDLTDVANNNIANSVPADLTVITPDTSSLANYKGAMVYLADLEGKVWKLNLTDKGVMYEFSQAFDAQATLDNERMNFFQVTPSIGTDGKLWTYFATGNQQKLQRMSNSIKNRIFGMRDKDYPSYKALSSATISKMRNNTSTGGICPTDADLGWYIDMDAHEKITGKLAIANETIFASRYIPNNKNLCSPGSSRLTEHDFMCGNTLRGTNLGDGVATGAVVFKGKIYVGISGTGTGVIKDASGNKIGDRQGNLIILEPNKGAKGAGAITYESWREIF